MILDTLHNRHLYTTLGKRFELAFSALAAGIGKRADGTYDLDGDNVRAIVQRYQSRPIEQTKWEAHRKYIDIQFIESGVEKIGWKPIGLLSVTDPYNAEKDYELFSGEGGEYVTVSEGMFAVFFPKDGHRPCIAIGKAEMVTKVVMKIAV